MEEINNNDFSLVHVCDTCGIRVRVLYSRTYNIDSAVISGLSREYNAHHTRLEVV